MSARRAEFVIGLAGMGAMLMVQAAHAAQAQPSRPPMAADVSGSAPGFELNQGQGPEWASHVVRARTFSGALAADRLWIQLPGSAAQPAEGVSVRLCGARSDAPATGEGARGMTTRLLGKDPRAWVRRAPSFGVVRFHEVWPGIDVVHRGEAGGLRYDFELAPFSDPCRVEMQFEGDVRLELDADGALLVTTTGGSVRHAPPHLFQPETHAGEIEVPVNGCFELRGEGRVGFHVADFDRARALVIDPTISLMLMLGGAGSETAKAVVSDGNGGWWVAGSTFGSSFPHAGTTIGNTGLATDAWVAHYDAQGAPLETLLIGGAGHDDARALAFDGSTLTIAGGTDSVDFPTSPGAFQSLIAGGEDAWVLKLDLGALLLLYSTYVGGAADDYLFDMAVDAASEPVLVGRSMSSDYPRLGMLDLQLDGFADACLTRLSSAGTHILWSGYYGGALSDEARAVDLDANSAALIAGTRDQYSAEQAFVLRVDAGGNPEPAWLFDGAGIDAACDIVADAGGVFHLLGETTSPDFPLLLPIQPALGGALDVFVLSHSDTQGLLASTFLGGPSADHAVALHAAGAVSGATDWRVLLETQSKTGLPLHGALCPWPGSGRDAYVAELDVEAAGMTWATFLPGDDEELPKGMAIDANGRLAIVGTIANRRAEHDQPSSVEYGACGGVNNDNAFLSVLDPTPDPSGGEIFFACTQDVANYGVAYEFFVQRRLGSGGAGSAQVGVYDEITHGYVPGVSATLNFQDGEQVAKGSIVLPLSLGPGPKTIYLTLHSLTGTIGFGGESSVRQLYVTQGSAGGGSGSSGSGSIFGDLCAATSASDGIDAKRGLDGLRAFRDRVLLRLPGGRALTALYYRASEIVVPWMQRNFLVHVLVSALILPLVAFAAHPGWWLLVVVIGLDWRRRCHLHVSTAAWRPRGTPVAVQAG